MLRKVLDRESCVKSNLIKRLIECVKELQFKHAAEKGAVLVNDEATNLLCWILEAVFIHGLKNPFLKSLFNSRENVEPSFWEFVLIFCHQEVIVQINKLSLISTDVGRCRAWLRIALNDGLFLSYLQMMLKDKNTVKEYYKPGAFLRDADSCDLLKSYLCGVESYDFQLACNSSLLNQWNSGPLSLVGLWTTSNPNDSISQGIDVAENMNSSDLQVLPSLQTSANSRYQRMPSFVQPIRAPLLNEDEAIRMILSSSRPSYPSSSNSSPYASPPKETLLNERKTLLDTSNNSSSSSTRAESSKVKTSKQQTVGSKTKPTSSSSSLANTIAQNTPREMPRRTDEDVSLNSPLEIEAVNQSSTNIIITSSSTELEQESDQQSLMDTNLEKCDTTPEKSKLITSNEERDSYVDLFQHHPIGTPMSESFLESVFPKTVAASSSNVSEENHSHTPVSIVEPLGFEVLSIISSSGNYSDMLPQVNSYLQRIPKEVGMDTQNYRCKNCDKLIGMIYGPAKLCGLSGHYFCQECHINEESVIPSRILLNWDFTRYSVSKQGKLFLEEIYEQPIFDLEKINSGIYNEVEEFEEVRVQREKLKYISLYLRTCKEPVMTDATKDLWPKEHLYDEVHLYSLADLLSIPNRSLTTILLKLVNFGKTHISSCGICQQKGFYCEICKDSKVIFPFEFETTYKCLSCGAVYHSSCMSCKKPCPRCQRISQRAANDQDSFMD